MQPRTQLALASPPEDPMRANVWPLLLVLTPTLCAQTEPPPRPFVPVVAAGELQARATSGDPAAQFQLAFHLFQTGRPPNYPLILNLLRSSTAQHYAPAQCMLGYLYENALGLPRDYTKAAENYRAAALQGHLTAQNNLANLYYTGHGVHKDLGAAFEWYRSAAEHGDTNAERNFGYLYF